jgi:O-antigen/teichoic acid export membrane protein
VSLKINVISNYLGQGWSAFMGLVFIPLYIHYLGVEAYGLIGLFAIMQAWLSLLDMGMTPTLNREMARYTSGVRDAQSIRDLLRSLEVLCIVLAVSICAAVWLASDFLASDWLRADKLPRDVIAQALAVMAVVVALRFVENIYRSSLIGLQRQVWFNSTHALLATLRHGGALAVLAWVSPSIEAFFIWQGLISVLTVALFAWAVYRALQPAENPARFSWSALVEIWRFAAGMVTITFLTLLLTQIDKILLSRLLTLESFGYYTLATVVAGALAILTGPITQAFYPRLVELVSRDDQAAMVSTYHQGAQLVTIVTVPVVMLLGFFAAEFLYTWSGDAALAHNTAPILAALVLGTFLNGLTHMPYQLLLAHGWTSLVVKVNVVAVVVLIPAIFWVVPRYGALGAAWIWVILNASYGLVAIQFMHRRLIPDEKWRWYIADLLLPIGGALGVILLAKMLQPTDFEARAYWFAYLLITAVLALGAAALLADRIRPRLLALLR